MRAQGLYDPAHEHDACGVGFVAHIKGEKSHSIVEQGILILKKPRPSRCGRGRQIDGRRCWHPDPDSGSVFSAKRWRCRVLICRLRGNMASGWFSFRKSMRLVSLASRKLNALSRQRVRWCWAGADVPVDLEMPMSPVVREKEPVIRQIFIGRGPGIMVTDALERKLYVIRKASGHAIHALNLLHGQEFFVASMSARTIVYKGLLLADQVDVYYKDLKDSRCVSALAMVHQRFSTNTFPEWPLAHPYRLIAHNGEINTVKGNFNWMRAREGRDAISGIG